MAGTNCKYLVALIAIVVAVIIALFLFDPSDQSDPDKDRFETDLDDYRISTSETSDRVVLSAYEDKCRMFLKKAVSDDDLDCDGKSTVANCLNYIQSAYSDLSVPEAILKYVQAKIDYTSDFELYGAFDWAAYPVETLVNGAGDCEDLAILIVSLLYRAGYPCGVLLFNDHAVAMCAADCQVYEENSALLLKVCENGQIYYCLDGTSDFSLGYTYERYSDSEVRALITV